MKKIYAFIILIMFNSLIIYAQWQPDLRLTNDPAFSLTAFNNAWSIAAEGNNVHVVCRDQRDGNDEIYYKMSSDGGSNWGADTRLTNDLATSRNPAISVSGSIVHIVWPDERDGVGEIYYKRSTDNGLSWEPDTRLTDVLAYSGNSSLAVFGSSVHAVWEDYRDLNQEIYYKHSTDSGQTWGTDMRLTNNSALSWTPSIAAINSIVHLVWRDERDGNNEIYYKKSIDGGTNWGVDTRLTINPSNSFSPSIAVYDSLVNIVWDDDRDGNSEVYYKRSSDSGSNWSPDIRLTNNIAFSSNPSISVSDSIIHVVWEDTRDGNNEIYYKRSVDGGLNWEDDLRLTNNSSISGAVSVCSSLSAVHVVWNDNRDGNWEVYYKQNPSGNITGVQNIVSELPMQFQLEQNYPNPFNPSTSIQYQVSSDSHINLKVYDVLGNEVATLVNEEKPAGSYEVEFSAIGGSASGGNAYSLPSGIYFYQLSVEGPETSSGQGFTQTRKMILVK